MVRSLEEMELYTKKIEVNKLTPGDILAYDLYLDHGAMIIPAGTKLTVNHIVRLKNMEEKIVSIDLTKVYIKSIQDSKVLMKKAMDGKPITKKEVVKMLQPLLKETRREKNIVRLLLQLQSQDDYTFQHTVNIGIVAGVIAKWMGYTDEEELSKITIAGTLHDIGKSKIPMQILKKPGPLTPVEFEVIKKHPRLGYDILNKMPSYEDEIKLAVRQHHEREDGRGYPQGLVGDDIHPYAKIIAVADVYHAMTSKRVYRGRISPFLVLDHLHSNMDRLDTEIILVFVKNMLNCLIGSKVGLSDGRKGHVTFVDPKAIGYPVIRLEGSHKIIDLYEQKDLTVEEILIE
ncbi:HD-GYP domain-containing protein [Geosporobacter ferrireducens]|uniref:HD-GYP domain-containing protein n=1 Tax=Geosporobacter ferrireducens TaxID=1424294 RepID=A0A1D8GIY9_9FIRM|nr:HD-GYP domain-containing protein [Geosporobacter ferrireducens]AOT70868.1 hypothetical protein Gferi_15670 [Geosporobacter ferrireducens]